jgi:hypothetical protein
VAPNTAPAAWANCNWSFRRTQVELAHPESVEPSNQSITWLEVTPGKCRVADVPVPLILAGKNLPGQQVGEVDSLTVRLARFQELM